MNVLFLDILWVIYFPLFNQKQLISQEITKLRCHSLTENINFLSVTFQDGYLIQKKDSFEIQVFCKVICFHPNNSKYQRGS